VTIEPEEPKAGHTPSIHDRLRPIEYIGMAAIVAIFTGLVVLGSTREPELALVFFGVAFIVSLVVIAMLSLAMKPNAAEQDDLDEQDDLSSGH
jgi:hypothetical protein